MNRNSRGGYNDSKQLAGAEEDEFIKQNEEQISALSTKIADLKRITIDIHQEVNSQNKLLEGMESQFDSTGGVLQGTMKKLGGLLEVKDSKHMCYLSVFIVFLFLLIYYIATHTGNTTKSE